jgi:hypothetical protein
MNWTKAIRKEPKAREPKWYLYTQYILLIVDPDPEASDLQEKYHCPQVAAMTNISMLMRNALSQRYPNRE